MIPTAQDRAVTSKGLKGSRSFRISRANESFIKMILRDKIYKNKVLAALREYSVNGWDAHRTGGKADVPIEVTLPTTLEPTLTIRDYGPGMSPEETETFTEYGDSTKRDSNDPAGCLGFGCKAGYAYGDQFTVTIFWGGYKRVYSAVLTDGDDDFALMSETPCGDETGVEIKIPCRIDDIPSFEQEARGLFPYFDPKPVINTDLPEVKGKRRNNGWIEEKNTDSNRHQNYYGNQGGRWVAVMGPIPYKIDLTQIHDELEAEDLWNGLQKMNGGVYFEMGAVSFTVSREELEYTDETKVALVAKFRALLDEYTEEILAVLKSSKMSAWDKRLKANFMRATLRLPIPARYQTWAKETIHFSREEKAPKGTKDPQGNLLKTVTVTPSMFTLRVKQHDGPKVTTSMSVGVQTKAYIRDDSKRHISGYALHVGNHVIICPAKGATVAEAKAEFEKWLDDLDCTGLTVDNLSAVTWHPRYNGRTPDRRHSVRNFKLAERVSHRRNKLSENWEIENWVPEDDDVFVILHAFKVDGQTTFYSTVSDDRLLAEAFGIPFPPTVYGYKTTARKEITAADCKGTEYYKWRKTFFRKQLNSTLMGRISAHHWSRIIHHSFNYSYKTGSYPNIGTLLGLVRAKLGLKHPISRVVADHVQGSKVVAKLDLKQRAALGDLASVVATNRRPAARIALDKVMAMYPLLEGTNTDLTDFVRDNGELWLDYILMADKAAGRTF